MNTCAQSRRKRHRGKRLVCREHDFLQSQVYQIEHVCLHCLAHVRMVQGCFLWRIIRRSKSTSFTPSTFYCKYVYICKAFCKVCKALQSQLTIQLIQQTQKDPDQSRHRAVVKTVFGSTSPIVEWSSSSDV